uniref:Uncharacterized protein n=1 Tax=Timema douglasi TaxID=61478 RepID=A0A7R8VTS9_TIMDO|nr:unnamed protein product [Timema douglasi]
MPSAELGVTPFNLPYYARE